MKKHFILTSLVAIAMSCPAMAATDVTFSGMYNGGASKIADGVADTTYDYVKSDGTTASGVAYTSDPVLTDFTYQDVDGTIKSLADGTPDISVYTGTTTASGDIVSTQTVAAGETASRDNYTYKNGAGEVVTLGENAQDMVATHTLSDYAGGAVATITNGTSDTAIDGSMYSFALDNGAMYTLSADGTKVLNANGEEPVIGTGTELESKFNAVKSAFEADVLAIENAKTTTADNWTTEQTNFDAANDVFVADSDKIAELNGYFETVGEATTKLAEAQAAQQVAADKYAENGALFQAAKDVYDAPILETITNGANEAIDDALAEGGAIRSELDVNATAIADNKTAIETNVANIEANATNIAANKTAIETNATNIAANKTAIETNATNIAANKTAIETNATNIAANKTAIETNATNIAANKTAIETNATNIAANKTAIEEEVARATAAEVELDGKIALNTTAIEEEVANRIAGDEMTLASAKAYVDSKNELALKSAYDYTDSKVNALEEDLSAGIASTAAMSSVAVSGVGKGEVSVGGGYGYYNSQSAIALGAAMGLTDNWSVNAAAGLADSNVTFRAGTNYKFKLF
ncbi:MAG: YadA-like family protein [Alphaproteobacteria bacterium]|nr:YadA-like family protein [Alphaproteobacteria bacterium]